MALVWDEVEEIVVLPVVVAAVVCDELMLLAAVDVVLVWDEVEVLMLVVPDELVWGKRLSVTGIPDLK